MGTVDTITTYTGNTPQTGDSYARIGALGAGLTALAPAATALSLTTALNAARNISAVADTSLTLNDAFHGAVSSQGGQETVVGTVYTTMTPAGTTYRIFAIDSATAPTARV